MLFKKLGLSGVPRFSLASLLWTGAMIAVVLGWWLDHSRLRSKLENIEKQTESICSTHSLVAECEQLIINARSYQRYSKSKYEDASENDLLDTLFQLWIREDELKIVEYTSATTLGHDILELLDCKTVDEVLSLVSSRQVFSEIYPEAFMDQDSGRRDFRRFVSRSLTTASPREWKW